MDRTRRLARALLAASRVARTLYHGTTIDNEQSIRTHGLLGGMGGEQSFVAEAYGDYTEEGAELPDLVFAADKEGLGRAVSAMVHHIGVKLGKKFQDVTDTDIMNHGLLVVIHDGEERAERRPEDDENYYGQHPISVEPGDYYAEEMGHGDKFVKGRQLLRLLKRYDQWPRTWGVPNSISMKKMRGWLTTLALRSNPEKKKQDVLNWVQGLSYPEVAMYVRQHRPG